MAREAEDREDLLTEATALVERAELMLPNQPEPVVVGFRPDGCGSVYFGPDPVYHFNPRHQLRRAFRGDRLYKAEAGELIRLTREHSPQASHLVRHPLSDEEKQRFLSEMNARLKELHVSIVQKGARVSRQVPAEGNLGDRIEAWLDEVLRTGSIAKTPHAR